LKEFEQIWTTKRKAESIVPNEPQVVVIEVIPQVKTVDKKKVKEEVQETLVIKNTI